MTNFFDYAYLIDNDDIDRRNNASISYPPRSPLKSSMLTTTILITEQYRPDKVAFRLYNNPLLSWVIDEANSFYSISDYTYEKKIYYPSQRALDLMGIDYSYASFKDQNFE
jgi:hypothetical protein